MSYLSFLHLYHHRICKLEAVHSTMNLLLSLMLLLSIIIYMITGVNFLSKKITMVS